MFAVLKDSPIYDTALLLEIRTDNATVQSYYCFNCILILCIGYLVLVPPPPVIIFWFVFRFDGADGHYGRKWHSSAGRS